MFSVTAVVLAAGASERMGEPKLLLPYRGATVLDATTEAVTASAVDRVIVVTGARAEEVEASLGAVTSSSPSGGGAAEGGGGGQGLRSEPFDPSRQRPEALPPSPDGREEDDAHRAGSPSMIVVRNPDYRCGNMSSLLTATAVDPAAEAFIVVPGDMPTIRTAALDSMIELWFETRPWAAVAEYDDRIAHPFLLSRTAVDAMDQMTGEKVLGRLLIDTDDDRVIRLSVPHKAPRDVNTPEDYEALVRRRSVDQ
ncbi:MAG: nucleotidyltransferase family protein [Actinomycetia bacterium]|nr:nucleotidyltransferase family protein [Actinomycetes bacterium]